MHCGRSLVGGEGLVAALLPHLSVVGLLEELLELLEVTVAFQSELQIRQPRFARVPKLREQLPV